MHRLRGVHTGRLLHILSYSQYTEMTLIQASMATPLLLNGGVSFRPLIPFLYTHPLPACKSIRNFKTNTNIKIRTSSSILVVRGASQVDAAQPSTSDKQIVPDSDLSITKISFGVVGLAAGTTLLSYGFGAYFNILPGSEWSALMLTYGFPLAIIGMALKYAELKPVPCITYSDALALRETKATPVLNQVRKDVARFRYGDEQHLDEALKRIFRYGQGGGIQRRNAPILSMIREEVTAEGKYSLVLVFEAKALQLTDFEQRRAKFASFFGPGVTAEVVKGGDNMYEVRLISDGTTQPTT